MPDHSVSPGSLVLYKIRPALVTAISDKIDISLEGGKRKRVRPKDVALLHPGPLQDLGDLQPLHADLREAWELVDGEVTDLDELSGLLFGEFTPKTAWAAWQQVVDGLYFEGTPGRIQARPQDLIEADLAERELKAAEQAAWEGFLQRLQRGELLEEDRLRLQEVEQLALGRVEHSRILQALGRQDNPLNAHRMLVAAGYWASHYNPYPQRLGLPVEDPSLAVGVLPEEPRQDLTHLQAFAIDDAGSEDPDDAISLDGDRVWVHVADVAALVTPGSALDREARARAANLYLPERIVHMLPPSLTHQLGLGLQERSPALSLGLRLDEQGAVLDLQVIPSWIRVKRMTYQQADQQLDSPPFSQLSVLAGRYRQRRMQAGAAHLDLPEVSVRVDAAGQVQIRPLQRLASRELVSEIMLMAGEAVAGYALERDLAMPFVCQPAPEQPQQPEGLAAMFGYRRQLRPSRCDALEAPHSGLGLAAYVRTTSPLRRYLDLVAHQQLRASAVGGVPLSVSEISERIAASALSSGTVRKAERLSNLHWKLVYLQQHPQWRGNAVVVEIREHRTTLMIPELAMETRLRLNADVVLDQALTLGLREVDLADQSAWFRVIEG